MDATAKKSSRAHRPAKSGRYVVYRGVKIETLSGKRSALAQAIRDGLRSKTERSVGEPAEA